MTKSIINWNLVYDAYPINKEMIWLNNAGVVPPGRHIIDAVTAYLNDLSKKGFLSKSSGYSEIKDSIKVILGRLLNCTPKELCLIHHTAEGMNIISHGIQLKEHDEIILLENEYPSNVYPWLHWKEKGVTIKTAPMGDSPKMFLEHLRKLINPKTRLISVSSVHWCTGMPLPIDDIGSICHQHDILFVVDGTQGVGIQPMDVKKANIDFMAFSTWKWLMGPIGVGVLYVSSEKLLGLKPVFIGTESVTNDEEYLPYKTTLKPDSDRFSISTGNVNDWVYLLASLEFLEAIGFENVRLRIFELTQYFTRRLRQIRFHIVSDGFLDYPTGIIACEKPGIASKDLVEKLKESRIIAVERLGKIRFSPHIYISIHQIDEVIRTLERICISQLYVQSIVGQKDNYK